MSSSAQSKNAESPYKTLFKPGVFAVASLLVLALCLRLYDFTGLPDDAHEWRQTQTLLLAQSYAHGANLLFPTAPWHGLQPEMAVLEFPLYSVLVYALSHALPLVTAARAISLLLGMASVLLFLWLARAREHPRPLLSALVFAASPIAIFASHSAQPESLLIPLVIAAPLASTRVNRGGGWRWGLAACASIAVGSTIKPTALVVDALPILWDAWKTRQWRWAAAVLGSGTVAMIVWGAIVRGVLLIHAPDWYYTNASPSWVFGPVSTRLDWRYYATLWGRAAWLVLPPGVVFLVIGAAILRRGDGFWWTWLLGSLVSVCVFVPLNNAHFYYQLPAVPALAALAAVAVPAGLANSPRLRFVAAPSVVLSAYIGMLQIYVSDPIYYHAGRALAAATPADKPVAVFGETDPSKYWPDVLFYSQRAGWNLGPSATAQTIDRLPGAPVCDALVLLNVRQPGIPVGWTVSRVQPDQYALIHRSNCPR